MCGILIKKQKGSYTVEAALLCGIWMLILFSSLLLFLGTIERIYLCGNAYEKTAAAAVRLVREETLENQEVTVQKDYVETSYKKQLKMPFIKYSWNIEGYAKRKIIKPVVFIEKIRKLKLLKEG